MSWNTARLQLCDAFSLWVLASGLGTKPAPNIRGSRARIQLEALSTQPWIHFALKGIFAHTFHPYPAKSCLQPLLRPTGKLSGGTTRRWMDGLREGLENQLLTTWAGNSEILGTWSMF